MSQGNNYNLFAIDGSADFIQPISTVIDSKNIANGSNITLFERSLQDKLNVDNICTVIDVSAAIFLALKVSGFCENDEVAISSYSCMSTNAPVANIGAKPLWIDLDYNTGQMDPADLEAKISENTKAVIVYHLAGYPADIKEISRICREKGCILIEDCSNAYLASQSGKMVGTYGDFSVYSFYPNRQINALEGGAVACRNANHASEIRKLRRYGIDLGNFRLSNGDINPDCDVADIGWSMALNNLSAGVGLSQLNKLEEKVRISRGNANLYCRLLEQCVVRKVQLTPESIGSYWVYLIQHESSFSLLQKLKASGVSANKLHYLTHNYSGFGVGDCDLPNAMRFYNDVVALPCHWGLREEDIIFISKIVLNH